MLVTEVVVVVVVVVEVVVMTTLLCYSSTMLQLPPAHHSARYRLLPMQPVFFVQTNQQFNFFNHSFKKVKLLQIHQQYRRKRHSRRDLPALFSTNFSIILSTIVKN